MMQSFINEVMDILMEPSDTLERGIHGYYPFRNRQGSGQGFLKGDVEFAEEDEEWFAVEDKEALVAMDDLAYQFAEEGVDEALPRLTRLAARFLVRPLRQGRRLSQPLQRQIQRSTGQAARTLIRYQGRAGIRAFPRLMHRIGRTMVRHRLSPQRLPGTVNRLAASVSARPCLPPLVPAAQNPLCRGGSVQHGGHQHRARIQQIVNSMCRQGWCDIRVDRRQVVAGGRTLNRPDVSGIHPRTGRRIHIEIDTRRPSSLRHQRTIVSRDPTATSTYVVIDPQTGRPQEGRTHRP